MGSAVTADLAACEEVDELLAVDAAAERAAALAATLGGGKVEAVGLDLRDRKRALEVLRGLTCS